VGVSSAWVVFFFGVADDDVLLLLDATAPGRSKRFITESPNSGKPFLIYLALCVGVV